MPSGKQAKHNAKLLKIIEKKQERKEQSKKVLNTSGKDTIIVLGKERKAKQNKNSSVKPESIMNIRSSSAWMSNGGRFKAIKKVKITTGKINRDANPLLEKAKAHKLGLVFEKPIGHAPVSSGHVAKTYSGLKR